MNGGDEASELCVRSNSYKKENYRAQYIVQDSKGLWWKIGVLVFEVPLFCMTHKTPPWCSSILALEIPAPYRFSEFD